MVCQVQQQASSAPEQVLGSSVESQQTGQKEHEVLHFNWDQRSQARNCMQTLVMALAEDPVNSYFSGSKRRHFVKDEVKGYLKALPGATHFIATADSLAVALWQLMPHETPRNELWAGWTRILKVPPRLWGQLLRLELHYEKAHAEVAADFGAYYYLSFIGTRPEARGKGYGGLLLRAITDQADEEGRWCLLEATSERSQALYARHGFVTYETYRVASKAPPVFLMKRPPAGLAAAAAAAGEAAAAAAAAAAPALPVKATTPLSAAALDLVAAVSGKLSTSPGSDCGSTASSALIGASVVIEDCSSSSLMKVQEGEEGEQQQLEGSGDAGVIICSSSVLSLKEAGEAAAAAAAGVSEAILGSCSSGDSSNKQDDMSSSSSPAGAGGPIDAVTSA